MQEIMKLVKMNLRSMCNIKAWLFNNRVSTWLSTHRYLKQQKIAPIYTLVYILY